jgi:hypothetical protein
MRKSPIAKNWCNSDLTLYHTRYGVFQWRCNDAAVCGYPPNAPGARQSATGAKMKTALSAGKWTIHRRPKEDPGAKARQEI